MRKSILICAVALAVTLCLALTLAPPVTDAVDEVTLRREIISGDPAAARGLTFYNIYGQDSLAWKIRVQAEDAVLHSDFRLRDPSYNLSLHDVPWREEMLVGENEPWLGDEEARAQEEYLARYELYFQEYGFNAEAEERVSREFLEEMEPGETKEFAFPATDFVEHYRYQLSNNTYSYGYNKLIPTRTMEELIDRPIDDGYTVYVTATKFRDGSTSLTFGHGNAPTGPMAEMLAERGYAIRVDEHYTIWTNELGVEPNIGPDAVSVVSIPMDRGSLVALWVSEDVRLLVEDSWFPQGFGVFYIPWEFERYEDIPENKVGLVSNYIDGQVTEGVDMPQMEELELLYPLDWRTDEPLMMTTTPDGRFAYLVTEEGEELILTTYSCTGELLQRQQMPETVHTESGYYTLSAEDNVLVMLADEGPFAVYAIGEDGRATLDFTGDAGEKSWWNVWSFGRDISIIYRDNKLAVVGDDGDGHQVAVYDRTGLLYHGRYILNLDETKEYKEYEGGIHPMMDAPQLTWTP